MWYMETFCFGNSIKISLKICFILILLVLFLGLCELLSSATEPLIKRFFLLELVLDVFYHQLDIRRNSFV